MSATDGPTLQDVERLNAINRGDVQDPMSGQWAPFNAAARDQIAQAMVAQSGPQKTSFGGTGFDFTDPRYTSRLAAGANSAGPNMSAMLAARQKSMPAAPSDYASLIASRLAARPQPAAAAQAPAANLWGANPKTGKPWANAWEEIAYAQAQQDANPYDQYFADKGPMSGSEGGMGWQNALQPWQGGSSGTLPGTGINTSGFTFGGGATRADPAYWGYTGPGTGWGTNQNAALLWEQLRQSNPFMYEQMGGDAAAAAGVSAGAGPGGTGSGAGGSGAGVGTGSGSGNSSSSSGSSQGPSSQGSASSPSGYSNAGYNPGDVSRGPDLGSNLSNSAFDSGLNQNAVSTVGAFGPPGFGIGETGYTGQPGFGLSIGTMGNPGEGVDGFGYGASEGDSSGSGAW